MQLINAETQSTTIDHRDCILLNTEDNKDYNHLKATGITQLNNHDSEDFDDDLPTRKVKKRLTVDYLNVVKNLVVNGTAVTGTSSTGTGLSSYGQLSVAAQGINLNTSNTWVPITFDTTGPSSNITVSTTSPATITVTQAGTYQINFSFYFAVAVSPETILTASTYTFGIDINGTTTPAAAIYANRAGNYSVSYSTIMTLSANDEIQFYMKSSAGDNIFANVVTLTNGNGYVLQISN